MTERKLATIQTIDEISPIEGADAIEAARIGGWWVVVKKDEYKVNDLCVYLEIDSWVPTELAPFLTKAGHEPKEFRGVKGERLKTIRLRGQLSQGLILPISVLDYLIESEYLVGLDVTVPLGIIKWEQDEPAQLAGNARGNFPTFIPKTDQERVQNLSRHLEKCILANDEWEVTEKLDGSSMTVYVSVNSEGIYHGVCSRNLDLKEDLNNSFWMVARRDGLHENLEYQMQFIGQVAIQGELIGPGIQGNPYSLDKLEFYLYDVYLIEKGRYMTPEERSTFAITTDIEECPFIDVAPTPEVQEALTFAEGTSALNPKVQREGVVYKSMTRDYDSFKAISNAWLIKTGK